MIRIAIVEDNPFYNNLLSRHLKAYLELMAEDYHFSLEIKSYTKPHTCLRNLKPDTDIVFLDYYLGDSVTGLEMMKKIREKCVGCKIIIISQVDSTQTSLIPMLEGASEFILKDQDALSKSCLIAEEIIRTRMQAS